MSNSVNYKQQQKLQQKSPQPNYGKNASKISKQQQQQMTTTIMTKSSTNSNPTTIKFITTTTSTSASPPYASTSIDDNNNTNNKNSGEDSSRDSGNNSSSERNLSVNSSGDHRNSKGKIRDLHDIITCSLCAGYLIEPTTITDCLHTYCRSCIVKFLERQKHCPICDENSCKPITYSSLRLDKTLKSLVFKLVPGLYESEFQRVVEFQQRTNGKTLAEVIDEQQREEDEEKEIFFSPEEPISLSLEYQPAALVGCDKSAIPAARYLQCPAAVTMQHLQKFLSSKYEINLQKNFKIDIYYEDEILPNDFSLIDVGYCFKWQRAAPMQFFYRIYKCNAMEDDDKALSGPPATATAASDSKCAAAMPPSAADKQNPAITMDDSATKIATVNDENEKLHKNAKNAAAPAETSDKKHSKKSIEYDNKILIKKSPSANSDNGKYSKNFQVHLIPSTTGASAKKADKVVKPEEALPVINDFKRLRSNDAKYGDYAPSSPSAAAAANKGANASAATSPTTTANANESSISPASSLNSHKSGNYSKQLKVTVNESADKTAIPKKTDDAGHLSSKDSFRVSDDEDDAADPEANGDKPTTPPTPTTIRLKLEPNNNKKCYVNVKKLNMTIKTPTAEKASSPEATPKGQKDIPKLKIELPSLKTKISIPKSNDGSSSGGSSKRVSFDFDDDLDRSKYGITEYAKHIGLTPKVHSPKALESSAPSDVDLSTPHKKRKKGKHSKDSKDVSGKRRKLHAEIQSQDENLKLKVKLTDKPSKHERKNSENEKKLLKLAELQLLQQQEQKRLELQQEQKRLELQQKQEEMRKALESLTPAVSVSAISLSAPNTLTTANKDKSIRPKPMVLIPTSNFSESSAASAAMKAISNSPATSKRSPPHMITIPAIATLECQNRPEPVAAKPASVATKPSAEAESGKLKEARNKAQDLEKVTRRINEHVQVAAPDHARPIMPRRPSVPMPKIMQPDSPMPQMYQQNRFFSNVNSGGGNKSNMPIQMLPKLLPQPSWGNLPAMKPQLQQQHQKQQQQQPMQQQFPPQFPSSPPLSGSTGTGSTLKRSASLDNSNGGPAKQARMEMMNLYAANSMMQPPKPLMFSPLAHAAKHQPTLHQQHQFFQQQQQQQLQIQQRKQQQQIQQQQQQQLQLQQQQQQQQKQMAARQAAAAAQKAKAEIYYKSTICPSFSQEKMAKKPLPMLLPPTSISVTSVSDSARMPKPMVDLRPSLEIVRISPNAPVADRQPPPSPAQSPAVPQLLKHNLAPISSASATPGTNAISGMAQKQNMAKPSRPLPPTIPLLKIKARQNGSGGASPQSQMGRKSASPPSATATSQGQGKGVAGSNTKAGEAKDNGAEKTKSGSDNTIPLDLSGKSSRSPTSEKSPSPLSTPNASPPHVRSPTATASSSPALPALSIPVTSSHSAAPNATNKANSSQAKDDNKAMQSKGSTSQQTSSSLASSSLTSSSSSTSSSASTTTNTVAKKFDEQTNNDKSGLMPKKTEMNNKQNSNSNTNTSSNNTNNNNNNNTNNNKIQNEDMKFKKPAVNKLNVTTSSSFSAATASMPSLYRNSPPLPPLIPTSITSLVSTAIKGAAATSAANISQKASAANSDATKGTAATPSAATPKLSAPANVPKTATLPVAVTSSSSPAAPSKSTTTTTTATAIKVENAGATGKSPVAANDSAKTNNNNNNKDVNNESKVSDKLSSTIANMANQINKNVDGKRVAESVASPGSNVAAADTKTTKPNETTSLSAPAAAATTASGQRRSSSSPPLAAPSKSVATPTTTNATAAPQKMNQYTSGANRQLPVPKLNEINKMRNTTVRQQNPSVRSIPNPSALAFRNQQPSSESTKSAVKPSCSSTTSTTTTTSSSSASSTTGNSLSANSKAAASATSTKSSSSTSASPPTSTNTKTTTSAPSSAAEPVKVPVSSPSAAGKTTAANSSSESLVPAGKKNIERVAVCLRAAASNSNNTVNVN